MPPRGPLPFRLSAAQRAFLVAQGVTSEATWAAFRLGCVSADEQRRFGLVGRRRLNPEHGISIPTWDLLDPATTVGVVRLNPSQNKHGFLIRPPAGIAGPSTLAVGKRIVMTDAPLVAMRLHQAGVADVALCEDPAVLPPMAVALRKRTVIIASLRHVGLDAMEKMLNKAGIRDVERMIVQPVVERSGSDLLRRLGAKPVSQSLEMTADVLREIVDHAQAFLERAPGYSFLIDRRRVSLPHDLPTSRIYRLGRLPRLHWLQANRMSYAARRFIAAKKWEHAEILPAYDGEGQVVDMMVTPRRGPPVLTMWLTPRGAIMPESCIVGDEVVAFDVSAWEPFGQWLRDTGDQPAWIVRGPADAGLHAAQLAAAGVRRCRLVAAVSAPIAARLRRAGISVTVMNEYCPKR